MWSSTIFFGKSFMPKSDLFPAGAMEDLVPDPFGQPRKGGIQVKAVMVGQGPEPLAGMGGQLAPVPGGDGPLSEAQ